MADIPACERCGQLISEHAVSHGPPDPAWIEARFPGVPTSGFYCRRGEMESSAT